MQTADCPRPKTLQSRDGKGATRAFWRSSNGGRTVESGAGRAARAAFRSDAEALGAARAFSS